MEETHGGTRGDGSPSRAARTPPPGRVPTPGSRPAAHGPRPPPGAPLTSPGPWAAAAAAAAAGAATTAAVAAAAALGILAWGHRAHCWGRRGVADALGAWEARGARGPLGIAGGSGRCSGGAGRDSYSSACASDLAPHLGGLSPACRLRAPGPRERRTCHSGRRRERAASRPSRPCPFPAEPRPRPAPAPPSPL